MHQFTLYSYSGARCVVMNKIYSISTAANDGPGSVYFSNVQIVHEFAE